MTENRERPTLEEQLKTAGKPTANKDEMRPTSESQTLREEASKLGPEQHSTYSLLQLQNKEEAEAYKEREFEKNRRLYDLELEAKARRSTPLAVNVVRKIINKLRKK